MCGVTTTNTVTGLEESWHDYFKIPVVHQASLKAIRLDPHPAAIHSVPIAGWKSLDFYAQLASSEELFVSLHGAASGTPRYPQFRRVMSMKDRVTSLLSFADPTLTFAEDEKFTIGWYTGGPEWDPLADIVDVVRAAQRQTGADHVMFLGASAGGHAALRAAANFPGSLAFVTDPQTDVGSYYSGHRDRLFATCWPGQDQKAVLTSHPERFDMKSVYRSNPENFVYYRQSTRDEWHERVHARPFEESVAGWDRYRFVFEPGERDGHGAITAGEFDRHFGLAAAWWRTVR